MKIKNMIRTIAVLLFTVILTFNSISTEASGLKIDLFDDDTELVTPEELGEVGTIGDGGSEPAKPMKDESPTHAYRRSVRIIKDATCTQSGRQQVVCGVAGCTIHGKSEETIPPKGHDLRYEYTAPTTTSTGWEGYKCSRCSYKNGNSIPKLAPSEQPTKPSTPSDNPGGGSSSGGGNNGNTGSGSQGNSSGTGNGNNNEEQEYNKKLQQVADLLLKTTGTDYTVGDPVDPFKGAHVIELPVISAGGVSSISVGLTYKSNKSIKGVFGNGFYWNYESYVEEKDGNILLYHTPACYVLYKKDLNKGIYVTDTQGSEFDEVTKNSDGTVTLNRLGKVFNYDKNGKLVKVTEKTGEVVFVKYLDKEIDLVDGMSGQTIRLIKNDKGLVSEVANDGTAKAYFSYDNNGNLIKYVDVDGFETTYSYSADGRVEKSIDADGNVTFEDFYNADGKVEKQKDALGVESFFSYKEEEDGAVETAFTDRNGNIEVYKFDKYGHLISKTDAEGNTSTSRYDDKGNCIEKTDALGNSTKYSFDEKNNLIKRTDALGNETTYLYDDNRNVVEITYPNGASESFTYDKKNRVIESIDVRGTVTRNKYDKNGQLIKTRTGDKSTTFSYENGNIKTFIDSYGNVTELSHDLNGHVSETKTPDGAIVKTTVSPYGTVLTREDAFSNVTSSTYNWVNKPLTVIDEDGNVSTCKYNELELLSEQTDAYGNTAKFFYDNEEHLIKTALPDGTFIENEYDKAGKLVSSTDAEGNKTTFVYDAVGNLIKEIDTSGSETTYSYDANGQVLTKTDSKGNVTSFTYDSMGRKVTETNALGGVTKYSYNTAGDLVSIEDALGNVTGFTYDEYGRKVSETDPNGNTTTFKYDLNSNLIETTNALGETTAYKYDSLNRLVGTYVGGKADLTIEETGEESFEPEPETEIEETQVASKDIVHVHKGTDKTLSANGCYTSSYQSREVLGYKDEWDGYSYYSCWNNDGGPNCQQCGQPISAGGRHKLYEPTPQYGYRTRYTCNHTNEKTGNVSISLGEDGLKAYVLYPDGSECHVDAYSWKLNNEEVDTDETCEISSAGTYELSLNLNDKYSGANQTVSLSYEVTGELFNELKKKKESSEVAYSFSARNVYDLSKAHGVEIGYDLNGRVVSETDPNGNTTKKVYDKRGNVSKVIDALGYETTYVYDKNCNLISSTNAKGQTISYEINSKNQIAKETNALNLESSYSYDNNGRLKSVVNPMGGVSENIFDKKGNVLELIGPNGAKTDFTYDSNNNLTSRSTVNGNSVKYTYNALNLADSMTNGRGQRFTYKYDLLGRVQDVTIPEKIGNSIGFVYDKNSNATFVIEYAYDYSSEGKEICISTSTWRKFDKLNRVITVCTSQKEDENAETVNASSQRVCYEYDLYGNIASIEYPDFTHVNYTYDPCGNIKTVTDWEGRVTSYNYDSLNREIECFNANGTKTEKGYDEIGNVVRLAEYKDHAATTLTAETILEYDQGNRLVKETETVKGIAYEYSYDDLSRVLLRKTINTKTGAVTDEETFGYDPAGNIVNSTGREAKKALSYIAEDNRIDLADGVKFTFDNDGNLISGKLFDKDATLTYDSRNRLIGFNDDSYVYDAEDYRIKSVEHITVRKIVSGGIFKLEEPGEYSTLEEPSVSDNNLLSEDFDSALSLDDSLSDKTFEFKEKESLDSLEGFSLEESTDKETVMSEPSDVSNVEETGKEDAEGTEDKENDEPGTDDESVTGEESVTSENSTVEANVTTDSQEASETETSTVSDNEEPLSGNETGTEDVSENEIDDSIFTFDDKDFIDRDAFGGLEDPDSYGTNGLIDLFDKYTTFTITTTYCYDRINKNLLVSDSSAGKYSKYVYGNGLIASYETEDTKYKAMSGQGVVASLKGETTEYRTYLYDLRGSVVKATNESGKTVAEYSYSTYGKRETVSGDQYSPLGYCARDGVLTDLNGLIYMRARYYSTELMRFINQDIVVGDISNSSSLNRYTYVEGNPATLIDPLGLCAKKVDELRDFLRECDWKESALSNDKVADLYMTLLKYKIFSKNQICMFLAQCFVESGGESVTVENGDEEYFASKGYDSKTCGSGYIQMSLGYEYVAYATYQLYYDYPELKVCGEFLPPAHSSRESIDALYREVLYCANVKSGILGIDIGKYTNIVDIGAAYVGNNYAWDSSGFYWSESKELNQAVASGASIQFINKRVGGKPDRYGDKEDAYEDALSHFNKDVLLELSRQYENEIVSN